MLKFRPFVNTILISLLLLTIGVLLWIRQSSQPSYLDAVNLTPGPIPDDIFVGDKMVPPVPIANFNLINYTGENVSNSNLQGKITLLSFTYTSCPDTCPIMFGRFLDLQKEFDNALDADIQLVFVTVDPEVDTPERLKQYTETLGGQWLFLTEELDIMREIWDTFHVYVEKEGTLVGHSNLTYLIDELGLIQVRYSGLPPTSAFAADIRKLQEQSP